MRKDCINRELTLEWIVGTFMFLILLALGYFTIIIGSDSLLRRTYPFEVRFDDVSGLRRGDNVTIRGMVVGKVDELELCDDDVIVTCALDQPMDLYEDYRIDVIATSVLGGRQLRIQTGSTDMPPVEEGIVLKGEPPINLMDEAAAVVRDVRMALTDGGVIEQVSEGVGHLNLVAGRLARGEGTIGALLADDAAYQDLLEITANLRGLAERGNAMIAALERGEGTLGQLLKDDAIGHDVRDVMADINAITTELRSGRGTLGKLLHDETVGEHIEAVLADMRQISERLRTGQGTLGKLLSEDAELYDDLARTMSSLRNLAEMTERGEGSLGQLVADDGLYQRAVALIDEIRATVDDFRESTPLTTFSSILFGAL